jgi:hypothetical protein
LQLPAAVDRPFVVLEDGQARREAPVAFQRLAQPHGFVFVARHGIRWQYVAQFRRV